MPLILKMRVFSKVVHFPIKYKRYDSFVTVVTGKIAHTCRETNFHRQKYRG